MIITIPSLTTVNGRREPLARGAEKQVLMEVRSTSTEYVAQTYVVTRVVNSTKQHVVCSSAFALKGTPFHTTTSENGNHDNSNFHVSNP